MGYWVINKHLESHLLISEGHPWGICDPLSRPKTLHTSSVCTIPQCLSTPALTFHPDIQQGFVLTWDWFRDFVDWFGFWEFGGLIFFSYTPHKSFFLAAAWEKKLLTAISSEGSWQCLQRTELTLCHGLFSSEGFSFGLEGKQGCREEEQW